MLCEQIRERWNKPVGPDWMSGFFNGVGITLLAIGGFALELFVVLPWMFGR